MGFNKRFISRDSIKKIAEYGCHLSFYRYFKVDALLFEDSFSLDISNEIKECTINDTDKIIKIMNKCK